MENISVIHIDIKSESTLISLHFNTHLRIIQKCLYDGLHFPKQPLNPQQFLFNKKSIVKAYNIRERDGGMCGRTKQTQKSVCICLILFIV